MKQLTVAELAISLNKLIKKGHGNKYVVLSNDNEGNGYHGCFFEAEPLPDGMIDLVSDSTEMNENNLVVIG